MNIRERTEQQELQILSPLAAFSSKSIGRAKNEPPCDIRTAFALDRDRIIHCKSFRRLKQKTQVFLSPIKDHYRTRLTHTLEVQQIARTIARALQLNEDLTEAIALGHDLGHTPFGHAGERALNSINPSGFKHFEQSVRMISCLEKYPQGLNLSQEVIEGIARHTRGEFSKTLEGQVVRYADRIAYINHDIEDAKTAGFMQEAHLPTSAVQCLGDSKSKRITTLVNSIIKNSTDSIKYDEQVEKQFLLLHEHMFSTLYIDKFAKKEEQKVQKLVLELYLYYKNNIAKLPDIYKEIATNQGEDTAVTDYISGMSDEFAICEFTRIFVPKKWE